jgi:autotransporter family porin
MGKRLNWMLSDKPANKGTSRLLRSRLAATTILAVVPFLGYGRQAYAYCDTSSSVWVCHGTETGISNISNTDAGVSTDGSLTVTSDGVQVSGDGYIQFNDSHASSITNLNGNGLDVRAYDGVEGPYAKVRITTNGTITGNNGSGIYARNLGNYNYVGDSGPFDTTIEVTGNAVITGRIVDYEDNYRPADGINALNRSGDLTITTGTNTVVRGDHNGIDAVLQGYGEVNGSLSITADGYVSGYGYDGIYARNGGVNLEITTGAESVVRGGGHGIQAINNGSGALGIEANGWVAGYSTYQSDPGDGIHAINSPNGTTLTITTGPGSTVRGDGDDGIQAWQYGDGDLTVNIHGSVTGNGEALEDYNAFGIEAVHRGSEEGVVNINVYGDGLVEGKTGGISVDTNFRNINIYNAGLVRNLSGESSDLAIETYSEDGGDTFVNNRGNLIGTVQFDAFDGKDTVDNSGFWNMAGGESDFGGSEDDTLNNGGVLVAADDSSSPETTRIHGLEFFNNNGGLISLLDGEAGDLLEMDGTNGTSYYGGNGRLAVDAALGPGIIDPVDDHLSDQLLIHGETDGATTVHVNVVAANGANIDGIPVVRIDGPTDAGTHFNLDGPLSGGFFTWDMRFDDANNWYELYTVTGNGSDEPVLGAGAFEFPAGFAATQDIWFQTINTALHRQADLRSLLQGLSVTPVADYSEPVEPTPIAGAIMAPGFWFQGFGAYVQRNDEQNGFDLDQKQTTYGGMAGFDFGTKEAFADAWLFGVFGGYIASDLKFTATDTKWKFEGPTAGAYVTYIDKAFYADATVKADFLNIKINPDQLASEADDSHSNAVNLGGLLDTGYKFGHAAFVEPQASLAVVDTEVDDVDIYGGTVKFDDDTSVRGRLGLRLGVEHTHTDNTVYSADVTGSVWENFTGGDSDVTVADTGLPDFGVSDNRQSTYGDIALGLSAANPDGWSSFVRGNYVFADDYQAWTGNAGVRFVW